MLFAPARAFAQAAEPESSTPAVVVTYDPMAAAVSPVIQAIRSHLTGMPVRILVEPVRQEGLSLSERLERSGELAVEREAMGAFAVEVGPRGEILVFFAEPDGRSALLRSVPPRSDDVSVVREEGAIVVRSLVQALLDGKRIGMGDVTGATARDATANAAAAPERRSVAARPSARPDREVTRAEPSAPRADESTPSSAAPRKPGADRSGRTVAASVSYVGTHFASELGWQSGVGLGIRGFALPFAYVGASYTMFSKAVARTDDATIELARHPLELSVGYEGTSAVAPIIELAVLVDSIHRSTPEAGDDLARTPDESTVMIGLGARGGLCFGPVEWMRGVARLGLDVGVRRPVFVSRRDASESVVEPSLLNPRIELGLGAYLP